MACVGSARIAHGCFLLCVDTSYEPISLSLSRCRSGERLTFNEREDEDILVEEGPQIERGTVFHRDACHREIYQRNIRDKRIPREAFFDLGDVKVENVIVTFNEEKDEYTLVEEGPQIERGTVFHRDACQREIYQRNIRDKRLPREA